MSKNKNEKGFTLVLSLVLLLAMSLMGGSLIVIASSDHQSNNSSDEYQQTFYVAETALMQAEKSLIDTILGPLNIANGNRNTNPGPKQLPINQLTLDTDNLTPCYKSFRNLSRSENFKYVEHVKSKKFLDLFEGNFELQNYAEKKIIRKYIDDYKLKKDSSLAPILTQLINLEIWFRTLKN